MFIEDGTGKGFSAKVDSENRMLTISVTQSEQLFAAKKGESFQIGSGIVSLTSASESAMLYVKNNETRDLILTGVNITSTASTGGSGNVFLAKVYLEATGITGGSPTAALNNNFGSAKTLTADITAGAEAATIDGGTASGAFYIPIETFFNTEIAWVVPQGVTLAVSITPPASNTSMGCSITLEGHLKSEAE